MVIIAVEDKGSTNDITNLYEVLMFTTKVDGVTLNAKVLGKVVMLTLFVWTILPPDKILTLIESEVVKAGSI